MSLFSEKDLVDKLDVQIAIIERFFADAMPLDENLAVGGVGNSNQVIVVWKGQPLWFDLTVDNWTVLQFAEESKVSTPLALLVSHLFSLYIYGKKAGIGIEIKVQSIGGGKL